MSDIYVSIGEMAVSNTPGQVIKTMSLGSCIGVIVYSPRVKAIGLLHVALPESRINLKRAAKKPGTFADTGIPLLLKKMKSLGVAGSNDIVIKLAGGANVMDNNNDLFNIGKRNLGAVKKILRKYGMGPIAEDVGGRFARSVSIQVDTGEVIISSAGKGKWEL